MNSKTIKIPCVTCQKNSGQFKCEGCLEIFCINHVVQHRQTLNKQLDEIIVENDLIQNRIYENKTQYKSLMTYIEQWEEKSIEKIRQIAKDTRQKIIQFENTYKKENVSKELETIIQQLKKAQQQDDFFETDLQLWKISLDKIKHQLKTISLSSNIQENKTIPLIYSIQLLPLSYETKIIDEGNYYSQIEPNLISFDERFDRCYGNAKITQNGLVVTNGNDSFFGTEIRGRIDYLYDIHQIRFQIENNPSKIWIFIGIISKNTPMGGNLFTSSSVYGWGDYDDYFIAGQRQKKSGDVFFLHTREHDIIELTIDCTKKKLHYTIERNKKSQVLTIDTKKCPFPWQLFVGLGGRGDQISLV